MINQCNDCASDGLSCKTGGCSIGYSLTADKTECLMKSLTPPFDGCVEWDLDLTTGLEVCTLCMDSDGETSDPINNGNECLFCKER